MANFSKEQIEYINSMFQELGDEKDRAAAVLLGAEIDRVLGDILNAYLLPEKGKTSSHLLNTDGPLGTLASRIEIVYRLGIISPLLHKEIHLLRKIRNHFAHSGAGASFDKPPISDIAGCLHIPQWVLDGNIVAQKYITTGKAKFILSGAAAIGLLTHIANNINKVKEHAVEIVAKESSK